MFELLFGLGLSCVTVFVIVVFIHKHNEKNKKFLADYYAQKKVEDEALIAKWKPYILGDAVSSFKTSVTAFVREFNLHFAQKCCMRMIPSSSIRWQLVDDILHDRKELAKNPHPSYAHIEAEFCVRGEDLKTEFDLFHDGHTQLGWKDADEGERIESWQGLIPAIEERLSGRQ